MAITVPPGVNIGQNVEDPFNRLLKLITVGSNIVGQMKSYATQRNNSDINTLSTIGKMVGNADDSNDLAFANQYIEDMGYSNNSGVNIIKEELSRQIGEKDVVFNNMQVAGDELAHMVTKSKDILDEGGNIKFSKRIKDMETLEAQDWFNTIKADDGYLGQVTEQLQKIKTYKQSLANTFGAKVTKDGRYVFTKTPNMTFKDAQDGDMHATEFLSQLDSYEQRLQILIEAGFGPDKTLNYEEAQHLIMGDLNYYHQVKGQRQEEFKLGAQTIRAEKNWVIDDIKSIVMKEDFLGSWILQEGNAAKFEKTYGIEGAMELFVKNHANIQITGNEEEMNNQMLQHMSTMTKQDIQMYYNDLLDMLNTKEESYKSGAIAWGFGGYFGIYPEDETVFSEWIEGEDKPTKMMSSKDFLSQFPFYEANSDTLAVKNNNPGNITFANQAGASKSGMFANFDNPMQGWKALYNQVAADTGHGDTIETFIKGHPEKDYTDAYSKTDQDAYVKFLMQKLKVPKNTLLSEIDKHQLVEAIAMQEGYLHPKTGEAPTLDIINRSLEPKKTKYELIEHEEKIKEDIEYKRGAVSKEPGPQESYDPSMVPETISIPVHVGERLPKMLESDLGSKTIELKGPQVQAIRPEFEKYVSGIKKDLEHVIKRKTGKSFTAYDKSNKKRELQSKLDNANFQNWWKSLSKYDKIRIARKALGKEELRYLMGAVSEELPAAKGDDRVVPSVFKDPRYAVPEQSMYDELRPGSPLKRY